MELITLLPYAQVCAHTRSKQACCSYARHTGSAACCCRQLTAPRVKLALHLNPGGCSAAHARLVFGTADFTRPTCRKNPT